jgi:hypothetical protein
LRKGGSKEIRRRRRRDALSPSRRCRGATRRRPDIPDKTAGVARTGGVALQFVGGTIINLVAE